MPIHAYPSRELTVTRKTTGRVGWTEAFTTVKSDRRPVGVSVLPAAQTVRDLQIPERVNPNRFTGLPIQGRRPPWGGQAVALLSPAQGSRENAGSARHAASRP